MKKSKLSYVMISSIVLAQMISAKTVRAESTNNVTSVSSIVNKTSNSSQIASSSSSESVNSKEISESHNNDMVSAEKNSAVSVRNILNDISDVKGTVLVKNRQGAHLINETTGEVTKNLQFKSAWLISKKAVDNNGQIWYKVSGNEYIAASDVYLEGTNRIVNTSSVNGVIKMKNNAAMVNANGTNLRVLEKGSKWQTTVKMVDVFGDVWYQVATNAYVKAADCFVEGQSIFHNNQAIKETVIAVVNKQGTDLVSMEGERISKLPVKSKWISAETAFSEDGILYYKIGGKEYISSKDVKIVDGSQDIITNLHNQNGVITVLNRNGSGTTTLRGQNNGHLSYDTSWKYARVGTDIYGVKSYEVGLNQFISATDVVEQNENMFQRYEDYSGVMMVSNRHGATVRNSTNSVVNKLATYSRWQITQKAIDKVGGVWYRVATNQYVSDKDMTTNSISITQDIIPGLPNNYSSNEFIVAHESGNAAEASNPNALENEVNYMKNHWTSAYVTHWVGGGGRIIQTAPVGRASWGSGPTGNSKSFAQVELARTNNPIIFRRDYEAYVRLLRFLANQAGIPVTLDQSGRGIKSHLWISNTYHEVDHVDPYGYLQSMGVSKAQFARDLANGI